MFGPTFGQEVIAAGLGGLPFTWGDDGDISGRENLTQQQNAALNAVIAAHQPVNLAAIKAELKAKVAADAEACRLRFITPGAGKAMSYQEKLAEARLVLDDPAAVTSDLVPILAAEAAARGITVQQAAELVHGTYRAFKAVEAQINATAILATKAISDASDAAAARAAYEAITWPRQTP